jgi:hypothetical protein
MNHHLARIALIALAVAPLVGCDSSTAPTFPCPEYALWNAIGGRGPCVRGQPQALTADDAGAPALSCAPAADDSSCTTCLKSACCAEGLACLDDAACTAAPDPTYVELTTCASEHCAAECPRLQ